MKKKIISLGIYLQAMLVLLFLGVAFAEEKVIDLKHGVVRIYDYASKSGTEAIKIHEYAAKANVFVNSQIVETKNSLVLFDVQLTKEETLELKDYALSLKKKLVRVIITHGHRDHYIGLPEFKEFDTYALPGTIGTIKTESAEVANVVPKKNLESTFKVDEVTYDIINIANAHAPDHAVIFLKDYRVAITGDLMFTKRHLLIYDFKGYAKGLNTLRENERDYDYIFSGHERVQSYKDALTFSEKYLERATNVLGSVKTSVEYIEAMKKLYPKIAAENLLIRVQQPNLLNAKLFDK